MILRSRSRPSEDRQREKGAVGSAQQIDIDSNVSLTAIAGLGIQRRCVVPSIVEQATAFFFYRYVWGPESRSGKSARGHSGYLPALYAMDDSDGPLANTIQRSSCG
jgi:hypothetical protein